ncbi:testis-expressed protein 11 isoform X4 [Nerophis lumbriciformis]|uniref:testis-expressed protein 11 isoform X4 n=1 Tax=Nerophis lumbriciformis TaxID=546530 RepID=UPI002ADFE59B|nr:testis-expressed protein 11 isoform X4 [Nerophis lumbriciformis]
MERFVSSVTSLTESLLQNQQTDSSDVIEKIFSEISGLEDNLKIVDPQLEECAIQLWNWAVSKNVGASLSKSQKAKVRHAACRLLYCSEPDHPTEGIIRKKILMASRTGRTWLDCKNPQMADHFLRLCVKSVETLYNQLTSRGDGASDLSSCKMDVEKDLLRVISYQAESALIQGSHQEAVGYVQRCKDILQRLPAQTTYLSLMCYNFGIDTYNQQKYEDSAFWLRQSYDIGKINVKYAPEAKVQAKVLRLLATVLFEWDAQRFREETLIAVDLANKECVSAQGLYLKITILLRCGASDESVRAGLNEMLKSEVSLEVCLSTVKLLISEDREALAFELLKRVSQQFESSPDLGTALVLHIELLLQRGKELLGKQKIEDIITGHYTGKQLAQQELSSLHAILWDKASKNFESTDYAEALQWYNYSLSFFKAGEMDTNLSKLQRNRASCFLHLKQMEKAKEAIKEAERCDPDSIFTQFSIYKIAVLENDVARAAKAVSMMALMSQNPEANGPVPENATSKLLSLAAQIALENNQQDTAMKALESLCESSKDEALVLRALRCLVRLVLSTIEKMSDEKRGVSLDVLLPYLKMALQKISQRRSMTVEQCTEEANWFRKIAWNSALQCESCPDRMRDFFVHSYQTQDLVQTLELIQSCAEVCRTLKATGSFPKDPTDTLLLLYEFEARSKLNDPKVESVLESILELEHVEAKVLETIAALAMEPPAHFPLLCKKALRVALSVHKKQPPADPAQRSKCIHSLIKLSLPSGVSDVEARVLEEAWDYYEEALAVIALSPDDFPETEILWLLTRAWNTGILLYSLARYAQAEKWCGLAMSFIRHLGSLQDSYKTQMSGLYTQILDRLDKAKRNILMEQ